jgi:uncharacterized protein YbaR (Trm112 family)
MHIELMEMLRCPAAHAEGFLVLSTGEMVGRMVRSGIVGCPVCRKEYLVEDGVVEFGATGKGKGEAGRGAASSPATLQALQALLELSGPGGYVVLLGSATRHAAGLATLMGGIHFVGINAPAGTDELPTLSLLRAGERIPLRKAMARGVIVGAEVGSGGEKGSWVAEAQRVLLRGRRLVMESETATLPEGTKRLAAGQGMVVGEKV